MFVAFGDFTVLGKCPAGLPPTLFNNERTPKRAS